MGTGDLFLSERVSVLYNTMSLFSFSFFAITSTMQWNGVQCNGLEFFFSDTLIVDALGCIGRLMFCGVKVCSGGVVCTGNRAVRLLSRTEFFLEGSFLVLFIALIRCLLIIECTCMILSYP